MNPRSISCIPEANPGSGSAADNSVALDFRDFVRNLVPATGLDDDGGKLSVAFFANKTRRNDVRTFQSEIGIFTNNEGKGKFFASKGRFVNECQRFSKIYLMFKRKFKLFAITRYKMKA